MGHEDRFDREDYEFNQSGVKGVYIIHGFSSSTYEVRELAEFLGNNGYHTIAKNLPGHGTTIEECNRMKYRDWIDHVMNDLAVLASQSDRIFVIGGSMGAVLALYASSIFPVNGCIVGGTVLKFDNPFTINFINRMLCHFIKIREKKKRVSKQYKDIIKFYGYREYPLLALNEFRKMNKAVRKRLSKVKCPALIIHSKNDRMSLKENIDLVFNEVGSDSKERLYVNHAHHNLFDENPDQKLIFNHILKFLNEH